MSQVVSPLPRLHHHDNCAVILHNDYCGVITLCHDKVLLSHFNVHKKRREKSHSFALTLTLTVTLRPDYLVIRHC